MRAGAEHRDGGVAVPAQQPVLPRPALTLEQGVELICAHAAAPVLRVPMLIRHAVRVIETEEHGFALTTAGASPAVRREHLRAEPLPVLAAPARAVDRRGGVDGRALVISAVGLLPVLALLVGAEVVERPLRSASRAPLVAGLRRVTAAVAAQVLAGARRPAAAAGAWKLNDWKRHSLNRTEVSRGT